MVCHYPLHSPCRRGSTPQDVPAANDNGYLHSGIRGICDFLGKTGDSRSIEAKRSPSCHSLSR